jgi:hypothetical protein
MRSRNFAMVNFILVLLAVVFVLGIFNPTAAFAHPEAGQSVNVAVIDTLWVINGGIFPTTTGGPAGSFTDFNFFILPVGNVNSVALGPGGVCGPSGCDTVLLNVASSGLGCNINNLSSQAKTDLVNFVGGGYKLIIYDSECPPQDYSWLPYTFMTSNPGAMGAQGTLSIVEENTLSSNDPVNPHYINAALLGSQTDAVGDMNVMTTFDPNWFLDMSGTNILGVTGPVHTYGKCPSGTDYGLIIYNGLDVDYMYSTTIPDASTPAGNLAKIWLHELQQPFNPSRLPSGTPVIGIALTPASATLSVGQNHTVTANLTDLLANPQPGIQVLFSVDSGPNAGATGGCSTNSNCTTDANGQVSFTYQGNNGIGIDQIKGCFNNQSGQEVCSTYVTVEWTALNELRLIRPLQTVSFATEGDRISATFTIKNFGADPINLDVLTVGGRDPNGLVVDFDWGRDITIKPNGEHEYKGNLNVPYVRGVYHFFCAYRTGDGKWNTSIELGPGLTDNDRVKDIEILPKTYIRALPFKERGGIIIPRNIFPEGQNRVIPIYVPEVNNYTNTDYEKDGWGKVKEILKTDWDFDWAKFIANFSPSHEDTPQGAAFSFVSEALLGIADSVAISEVKIVIQQNSNGNFRAIILLGDPDMNTYLREDAGSSDCLYIEPTYLMSKAVADAFKLDRCTGLCWYYTMCWVVDSSHKQDNYVGYLSYRDKEIVYTPRIYVKDKISVNQVDFPIFGKEIYSFKGEAYVSIMESFIAKEGAQITRLLSPIVFVPDVSPNGKGL